MTQVILTTPAYDHIVVVVEENHSATEIIGNPDAPYLNALAHGGVLLSNYHAVTHPSQPNYFALYAGSTFGVQDNGVHSEPDPTLATILAHSGETFLGYAEAGSPAKHNPWESFSESASVGRPFSAFPFDDFSRLPDVAFVVPNLLNDMHDGTIAQGDQWLESNIGDYAQWALTHHSLLIVTWDEDDFSLNNQVPAILFGDDIIPGDYGDSYTHYDLLRTVLGASGLSGPNEAAHAAGLANSIFLPPDNGYHGDFNGDHKADLLVRAPDGTVTIDQMNGTQIGSTTSFGVVGSEWYIDGVTDFDGNGMSDVLWRANDGTVATWLMNGPKIVANTSFGITGNEWHISGTADFGGDSKSDILWRSDSGALALWQMNGTQIAFNATLAATGHEWHIVALADFGGDHKNDILWRSDSGIVALWQMNGAQIASNASLGTVDAHSHIVATGDFGGDGKADILWRAGDGTISLWQMNGSTVQSNSVIGVVGKEWHVDGTGDFNGDSKADILWRADDGTTAVWMMNGSQIAAAQTIASLGDVALGLHHYDLV